MSILNYARSKVRDLVNKVTRPSAVTSAQKHHLRSHPWCIACGATTGGQAHHVQPYNKFPNLGADPANFVTLCQTILGLECHLHIGHGGNFKWYNPNVVADANAFRVADDVGRKGILLRAAANRLVDS